MSKITSTKLSRARFATKPVKVKKEMKFIRTNRIVGYEPCTDRKGLVNPKNPKQFALVSIGQSYNWGKAIKRGNNIFI